MANTADALKDPPASQEIVDLSKSSKEIYDRKLYKIHDNLTIHVETVPLRQNFRYDALVFTRLPREDEKNAFKFHIRADVIPRIVTALNEITKSQRKKTSKKKKK